SPPALAACSKRTGELDADALALGVQVRAVRIGEVERALLREELEVQAAAELAQVAEARPRFARHGAAASRAAEGPAVHDALLEIDRPPSPPAHRALHPRADDRVRDVLKRIIGRIGPGVSARDVQTDRHHSRRARAAAIGPGPRAAR